MAKRKTIAALTAVLAAGTVLGACGNKAEEPNKETDAGKDNAAGTAEGDKQEKSLSIAMVTDVGGIDDKSFNQLAWEGIQSFGKDNGLQKGDGGYDYLQSASNADYNTNLNNLVRRNFSVIFGVGYNMADAIGKIADQQKDAKFAIIDAEVQKPNVTSVLFKENEGSYLAGVAAALMTKTKKLGFVGGQQIPVIERFHAGFVEGVKAVDPNIKVDVKYTGAFDKAELGKTEANRMYSSGVDIIFHAAGGTGNGVFAEAKERKQKDANADVWVIGVDSDQYAEGQVGDKNITLTSMQKRVDVAVQEISKAVKEDKFEGGKTVVYGLKENGVQLADSRGAIPEDVMKKVDEYAQKITSGEVKVPEKPAAMK